MWWDKFDYPDWMLSLDMLVNFGMPFIIGGMMKKPMQG